MSLMFSGILQGSAIVTEVSSSHGQTHLRCGFPDGTLESISIGASISIDGVCLTVVSRDRDTCDFDVVRETLERTTLGTLKAGDRVNFERALRYGDEVGGHFVSGHVDFVGEVTDVEHDQRNVVLWIRIPSEHARFVMEKGYIGLHGASLTIAKVREGNSFAVSLIPETLRVTTFGATKVGARLNVEVDRMTQAIVETTERVLRSRT